MPLRENDPIVEFHSAICKKETDSALLVEIDDKEYWIPKSQLHPDSEVQEEDDTGTITMSEWIAKQKGLV